MVGCLARCFSVSTVVLRVYSSSSRKEASLLMLMVVYSLRKLRREGSMVCCFTSVRKHFSCRRYASWLKFTLGSSKEGGQGVMNLGQAYEKSSSKSARSPAAIFVILSLY